MKIIRSVLVVAGVVLVVGPAIAAIGRPKAILPVSQEPPFVSLDYSELPKNVQMVVRLSSREVFDAVLDKYPAAGGRSEPLEHLEEHLVMSQRRYFRRLTLYLSDPSNVSEHGVCGQPITVWFSLSGQIEGIYATAPTCPV